ncbi:hypothetical protein Tco_1396150 [Tanacetum coccineum]
MVDKKDIIYTVDMFCATLKLLVETPKQPFIPPYDFDYIWPFLKILGYQGSLERVSAFFIKNLAQPWQTLFKVFNRCLTSRMTGHDQTKINIMQIFHVVVNKVHVDYASLLWSDFLHYVMQKKSFIQYPRFTKLIIVDLIEKYESIPKRLEEEYHTIKDDTPLVSVYTTGEVIVRGMQIPNDLLTDAIRDTQAYKDYVEKYERVEVPTIQPEPVESTQGMHRKPRATRTPKLDVDLTKEIHPITPLPPSDDQERDEIIEATQLRLTLDKTAKVYEEQQNVAAVVKKILEEDVENLIEGEDESDGDEFADTNEDDKHDDAKDDYDNDDDDHDDHSLIRTWKTDLSSNKAIIKELMVSDTHMPDAPSQDPSRPTSSRHKNLTGIVAKMSRRRTLREQVPQWTISTTSDLIKEALPRLVLQEFAAHAPKIIEELFRIQMHNTVLNNALKAKYEKSLASPDSCRYDAFRKRDHDNHQGDDVPFKGEKSAKRQKTSIMIDEDEVIPEDETHDLLNEFQNVDKRVPAIYDRERIEATIREMLSNQFRDAEEYAYHLKQEKKFMENQVNGNTEEKKYVLSLHKIHATSFPEEDLEESMNRWVKRVFKMFNEEARLLIQHWKDTWHKRMYKINHIKVRDDQVEFFFDYRIVEVVRLTTEQQYGLHYMQQIIVMRENVKPDSFSEAEFKYLN